MKIFVCAFLAGLSISCTITSMFLCLLARSDLANRGNAFVPSGQGEALASVAEHAYGICGIVGEDEIEFHSLVDYLRQELERPADAMSPANANWMRDRLRLVDGDLFADAE